jgi:hypothetical protein
MVNWNYTRLFSTHFNHVEIYHMTALFMAEINLFQPYSVGRGQPPKCGKFQPQFSISDMFPRGTCVANLVALILNSAHHDCGRAFSTCISNASND